MGFQLLQGLRVIESSAFIAAPLAGMTLAQSGADVIRIDLPGGGIDYRRLPLAPAGRSLYWTGLNKGKRSLAVDIRRPEGRELVRQLVTSGDEQGGVLLTNLGSAWLSHASLAAQRPDLITCTIEGNSDGSTAVDYTVNCATGLPTITGNGSVAAPVNHVLPAWDIACAYQAAFALVAAVSGRRINGVGAELRIALSDIAFSLVSHLGMTAEAELLDADRQSTGNYLYGAFGRDFGTCDGRRVFVAAISLNQWKNLVSACDIAAEVGLLERELDADFSNEVHRYRASHRIAAHVEQWITSRSYQAVAKVFDTHGVCWGPYQTMREALRHDARLSEANPIFSRIETAGVGNHLAAGSAVRIEGHAGSHIEPAPLVGQHTDEILLDVLGLDSAMLGRLHDAGIVCGAETPAECSVD
ncbi:MULTISPECIES: CoA transferase [unclassified Cupriavidus]|uniref:CoA transferase n=1 Tax=unclassified Cupriavidus TaxID=2640874 RepID=UPI001C001037|nr:MULTISPECIES: CoA transferase [unclassified Cupriavidus]MCA3189153.1 CoA transferase [Cupriavidus sp.]MCA3198873.1 CoA transferase [Cupriavidus sp.]MCA3201617.1 CoA transferase [Cupriavidus sp.]QWE97156.1 CoA transferase [Cupriavidus sp. EM10]